MGKNTRKPAAPRKSKFTPISRSSPILFNFIKTKLIRKTPPTPTSESLSSNIKDLLNQQVLTCSICLQLLLSPVLAQCGHSFCLNCAEDLAKNGFACGICHSHEPDYELPGSSVINIMLKSHIDCCQIQEKQHYEQRTLDLEKKEQKRLIGDVQEGEGLDFWCNEELSWKNGTVSQVLKNGTLTINPRKGNGAVTIHSSSRRLAPLHHFTPQEPAQQFPEMHIRPIQLMQNRNFDGSVRMPIQDRPQMFGMPLFLGYFWRGGEDVVERNNVFDGVEPFNF